MLFVIVDIVGCSPFGADVNRSIQHPTRQPCAFSPAMLYLLIPRYGSWGAVAATLIGFIALLVGGQIYSQRLWPCRFEFGRLARIAVCMAAVVMLGRWIPPKAGIWQFLMAAAVMAAFPVLLFITGFFHADERGPELRAEGQEFFWMPVPTTKG